MSSPAYRSLWWLSCIWIVAAIVSLPAHECRADDRAKPAFQLDPVMDSLYLAGALLATGASEALITTGEITIHFPTRKRELLGIDAWVIDRQSGSLRAAEVSDIAVLVSMAWGITDIVLAGFDRRPDSALTYGMLYLQSAVTTWMVSNVIKLTVRRPRPHAYIELREQGTIDERTQQYLSFYSLHTALAASLSTTAVYLAFNRDGPVWEKWLLLGSAIVVTSAVGIGRILAAAHFTTDVLAGLGVGVLVGAVIPHLHRVPHVRVAASADRSGGAITLIGRF